MPLLVDREPSVGEDAFVWLVTVVPLLADVVNGRFTFETLTATTVNRLHFPAYDKFLKEIDRCIKHLQKQDIPTGVDLVDDELVSGAKKSHAPGWLIGRHDPKCLKTSTQASAPAPTDSYVQELTKKIRQEVVVEVEAKVNQKVCTEVDDQVKDNMTLVLKKLAEANPTLNIDIGEICATISSDTVGDGTPMTDGPSS